MTEMGNLDFYKETRKLNPGLEKETIMKPSAAPSAFCVLDIPSSLQTQETTGPVLTCALRQISHMGRHGCRTRRRRGTPITGPWFPFCSWASCYSALAECPSNLLASPTSTITPAGRTRPCTSVRTPQSIMGIYYHVRLSYHSLNATLLTDLILLISALMINCLAKFDGLMMQ